MSLRAPDPEPLTLETVASSLSGAELRRLLDAAKCGRERFDAEIVEVFNSKLKDGDFKRLSSDRDGFRCNYSLLKVLLDDKRGWPQWRAVGGAHGARESAILTLWGFLDDDGKRADYVRAVYFSLTYHRHRIFEWLLGRYQLGLARSLWQERPRSFLNQVHFGLLAAVLAVFALRAFSVRGGLGEGWVPPVGYLLAAVYVSVLGWQAAAFRKRCISGVEALGVACQSLIPRLAAASLVGALMLASSRELLEFVVSHRSRRPFMILAVVGLAFVILEMFRRLQPLPGVGTLAGLAAGVAATAFAHSLSLSLVLEPGLRQILGASEPFSPEQVANIAAFFFTIGLTVHLIWTEESVTQPL